MEMERFRIGARAFALSWLAIGVLTGAVGCASKEQKTEKKNEETTFVPAETERATDQSKTNALYMIPQPTEPEGSIKVDYKGVEQIRDRDSNQQFPALHVSLEARNDRGKKPWTIDARTQQITFQDGNPMRPAFVHALAATLPIVTVEPGEARQIELYYAIPKEYKSADKIPGFDLRWNVQTATQLASESTPFDRATKKDSEVTVYPFDRTLIDQRPDERFEEPTRRPSSIGGGADWWIDPMSEPPFPWRDVTH